MNFKNLYTSFTFDTNFFCFSSILAKNASWRIGNYNHVKNKNEINHVHIFNNVEKEVAAGNGKHLF